MFLTLGMEQEQMTMPPGPNHPRLSRWQEKGQGGPCRLGVLPWGSPSLIKVHLPLLRHTPRMGTYSQGSQKPGFQEIILRF